MGLFSIFKRNKLEQIAERDAIAGFALSMLTAVTGANRIGSLSVSPRSMMGVAAIFAAVRIRGETLANLPFGLVQETEDENKPFTDSPAHELLKYSPDGDITAVEFFQSMESHSSLNGVAYAYIERNMYGEPMRLIQVPCYEVSVWVDDYGRPSQRLAYNVRGQHTEAKDLIVIKFGSIYPYWQNPSPSNLLSTPIALAQAIDKEAENLFRNGCSNAGVLETDGKVTKEAAARLREYLAGFKNGGSSAGSLLILQEGLKYVSSRMSNKDAEFVESKKQSIRDASAIWGVPSYRLGDGEKANYASQEEANNNFLNSTMLYRVNLFENELRNKILSDKEKKANVKVEVDFLNSMRVSVKDRVEYYTKLFNVGAIETNKICKLENLPSAGEDGKKRFIPVNMMELGKISKEGAGNVTE